MPYPTLPEDFAGRASLLRYIGDVINAQNRFKGLRANPYTEMGEPTPGGGRGFSPRDFSKEGRVLNFPGTNPKVAPEGFENFPGENMGTPQKFRQIIDTEIAKNPAEGVPARPAHPPEQAAISAYKRMNLATHTDLVKMGQDYGLSYERMVQALNGTQAAGMKSTPENIKYWIAQMRQKGLFHPETGGE